MMPSAETRNSHVPAPTYPASRRIAFDDSTSWVFCASVRNGAGASSTSFWWRRCSEQSRVETTTTVPCWSARHCVSTCRGRSRYRSTKHSPRPNAATASRVADSNISSISLDSRATFRPRPPPPNAALMATGRPCSATNAWISSTPCTGSGGAGDQRRAGPLRDVPCADLVPEGVDGRRRGTDPDQPGVDDGLREAGVLGEEAVAGVHGVGPGAPRDVEQLGDVEVRLGRAGAVQRERLVGDAHVQRLAVGVGVDGDGADPGVATGTGDADGDLTAVGDEDLGDGGHGSP